MADVTTLSIIEKASGRVRLFDAGAISSTALNLNVQNDSERGLLGIALDPARTMRRVT